MSSGSYDELMAGRDVQAQPRALPTGGQAPERTVRVEITAFVPVEGDIQHARVVVKRALRPIAYVV